VVRRLVAVLQGKSDPQEACKKGLIQRKKPVKNSLATRDVHKEADVLALETTRGRKRVYKRKPGNHTDGSFEMVQVSSRAHQHSRKCPKRYPKLPTHSTPRRQRVSMVAASEHLALRSR
jgi:hypothetical protein